AVHLTFFFFFQAEDGIRAFHVTGVQTCALPISVVDEAITLGCDLVISHHPIVFKGLKRFNGSTYVERVIMKAIKHDIALYAIHRSEERRVGKECGSGRAAGSDSRKRSDHSPRLE